jgi:hypothetical protein
LQSTVILTHHKAASTLLRRIILANKDPRFSAHDFAGEYWSSPPTEQKWVDVYHKLNSNPDKYFKNRNHVYGPLRKSIEHEFAEYKKIIIARDPVETLVSSYVSFGYTHPIPTGSLARKVFIEERNRILQISLDDYVLDQMTVLKLRFLELQYYSKQQYSHVVPYDEIVSDPRAAISKIYRIIGSRMPVSVTMFVIKLLERRKGVHKHRSRERNFPNLQLSNGVKKEVYEYFSELPLLWRSKLDGNPTP